MDQARPLELALARARARIELIRLHDQTMPMSAIDPILALVGPTGAGKTELSLRLAARLDAEIVNCDSRQVFRFLDIGTAKPTAAERAARAASSASTSSIPTSRSTAPAIASWRGRDRRHPRRAAGASCWSAAAGCISRCCATASRRRRGATRRCARGWRRWRTRPPARCTRASPRLDPRRRRAPASARPRAPDPRPRGVRADRAAAERRAGGARIPQRGARLPRDRPRAWTAPRSTRGSTRAVAHGRRRAWSTRCAPSGSAASAPSCRRCAASATARSAHTCAAAAI